MADSGSFGENVKRRRKVLDLTQAELAERVGCATSTIRMVELGSRRPSRQLAELLADHLKVETDGRVAFLRAARQPQLSSGGLKAESIRQTLVLRNVPQYLTTLLGREEELKTLEIWLCEPASLVQARLLTLTGPGGVGKTRLAATLATKVQARFAGGVFFVSLAAVRESVQVFTTLAAALDLKITGTDSTELVAALTKHLYDKQLLLVLDNMEQILEAGPYIAALMAACPQARALVTSREPLHVRGEHIFAVPPLALPNSEQLPDVVALSNFSAVALFLARAKEVLPTFRLTNRNSSAIIAICARLDGLPLAIELVAARIALFPPQILLAKLGNATGQEMFRLLGTGARDLPPRQQSLYTAIGWSYNLLGKAEQRLFAQLSVFVGGCTLSAIEAVCGNLGDFNFDVLASVTSLVNKNLVMRDFSVDDTAEPRFVLLQTLRDFAEIQLENQGHAAEKTRQRHANLFLTLAEAAAPAIISKDTLLWTRRLATEHDNIHAALNWFLAHGEAEQAARLAGSMGDFWMGNTHMEAMPWLMAVLELRGEISIPRLITVVRFAGVMAVGLGNLSLAQTLAKENLDLAEKSGQTSEIIRAHFRLGAVAGEQGNWASAEAAFGESFRLARLSGDLLMQSVACANLGDVARGVSDYAGARDFYEEGIRFAGEANSLWYTAVNQQNQGRAYLGLEKPVEASHYLLKSLQNFRDIGSISASAYCLSGLGETLIKLDMPGEAAVLLGAAEALLERNGIVLERVDRTTHENARKQAQLQLGPDAFKAAYEEGGQLEYEQAVDLALHQFSLSVKQ